MNDKKLKEIIDFQKVVGMINKELNSKDIYDCEYLLIKASIEDVIHIIEQQSEYYDFIKDDQYSNGVSFKYLLEKYFQMVKKYYDSLMIQEGKTDKVADKYMQKMKENTQAIYSKENIKMTPMDVEKSLRLMKEAVGVYFKVYDNVELIAELSTKDPTKSEYLEFEIKLDKVLHLLGVTAAQLVNNPDFQRIAGGKKMKSTELLGWILKDIDGNNDLLQSQEDFLKKVESTQKSHIVDHQFNQETSTQLLNYYKIRAKSETFLRYGPFDNVSLVAKLAPNKRLSQHSNSNTAMITRAETFRKYPWAYFGSVQNANDKYINTLIIDSSENKKELFKGSRPAIVKKVGPASENPNGGGRVFSAEEQFELFFEAYESFSDAMDFTDLIEYFDNLNNSYGKKR